MCPMHKSRISKSIVTYSVLKEKMLTARPRDRERGQWLKNKWIKQVGIKELCKSYSLTYKTLQRRLHDMKFAFFWTGQSLFL